MATIPDRKVTYNEEFPSSKVTWSCDHVVLQGHVESKLFVSPLPQLHRPLNTTYNEELSSVKSHDPVISEPCKVS